MKIKAHTPLLALLFVSGFLHAETTIPNDPNPTLPGSITAPLTIQGDTTVNGTLFVKPAVAVTANNNLDAAGQMNAVAGTDNGTSTAFRTVLGGAVATYETAGGAEINNNGDTTLSASDGSTVTVTRVTETRIFNADQGVSAGQPVPDIQSYYLIDAAGNEIAGTRVSVNLADPALDTAAEAQALFANKLILDGGAEDFDFTSPAFAGVTVTVPTGTGGNLNVEGLSTTNGIDNSGEQINNIADGTVATDAASVGQVAVADAAIQADVDQNELDSDNADAALGVRIDTVQADVDQNEIDSDNADAALGVRIDTVQADVDQNEIDSDNADAALGVRIDTEATTRANADTALGQRIDTESANSISRDNALGVRIDTEATTRANADTAIRSEFAAADNVVRSEFAAADNVVRSQFAAADNVVRSEFAAADSLLSGRINDEVAARIQGDTNLGIRIDNTNNFVNQQVNRLDGRIDGVQFDLANETNNRIAADNALRGSINKNTRGIAMVAAMTNTRVEAGKTHGVDFNMAQFGSETGFAFGYANRVNENVQVHGALASTTDFDESVVRVGVSVQW